MEASTQQALSLEEIENSFSAFLDNFQIAGYGPEHPPEKLYVQMLAAMADQGNLMLEVNFQHLLAYDRDLAETVEAKYILVEPALKAALRRFAQTYQEDVVNADEKRQKEFWLSFTNLGRPIHMRNLRTELIGGLVAFKGTVTRTGEVRPELYLATFRCNECGQIVENVQQQFKYTQPTICPGPVCGNRINWELIPEKSEFVDWQRAKVQEDSDEVPAGSLPRFAEVILRHDLVESVRAGDKTMFTGNLIALPDVGAISTPGERLQASLSKDSTRQGHADRGVSGLKLLGTRELTYKLGFLASSAKASDFGSGGINIRDDEERTPDEVLDGMPEDEREQIEIMKGSARLYDDLIRSLAPGVHGHEDAKRAILLMLLGGVEKQTSEGIHLRGDINVAIVGDPSCAKSQLLKYVAQFLPRAVFTSGKSSSAAGLTASVVKEPDSNEFCIEAGALMLADNGICCIDEFDKMDDKDQIAIHEAMEQQTISIAKAGIQATLNARTSILAAANPSGGRYDKSKPLRQNVGLPPAILSRFDLLHIMVDTANVTADTGIATHIVGVVHRGQEAEQEIPYHMDQIQRYIRYARSFKPAITPEAKIALVEGYKQMREEDAVPGAAKSYRMTVRQLEALIRLSEAFARMRCSKFIQPQYVREAIRLMKRSIISVDLPDMDLEDVEGADVMDEEIRNVFEQADAAGEGNGEAGQEDQPMANADDQQGVAEEAGIEDAEKTAAARQGIAELAAQGDPRGDRLERHPVRVSTQKLEMVKSMLVSKLRSLEGEDDAQHAVVGSVDVTTMVQHELMSWYFRELINRGTLTTTQEVAEETALVGRIIQHLIRREGVLAVIETPQREPDESDADFARRQQHDRVLAVVPTYADE